MTQYDLGKLNDKEFEILAADLVSTLLKRRVERFKPGKDQGVDGRFFSAGNKECIVQAKHWEKSGYSALLAHLTKSELPKIRKLNPARYLLVTSVPLSRLNKTHIAQALAPYLQSGSDIFGQHDVQQFLAEHPEIAKRHYKLWLASSEVLRMIYSAPIIGRSRFKTDEVVAFAPKYVVTSCHKEAVQRLDRLGSIIINGEPGVGKTTLADQIALYYVINGFELCFVENSLNEAEGAWSQNKKQVFYFDDFLGRNYLEALQRHEDSHVIAFMGRVKKDGTKRFILTSRTTILNQGKALSDLFRANNIDRNEYEIRIVDLSMVDKARILYNHIWFGDLRPKYVEALYTKKRYRTVIEHTNFNPRLISFITDSHKIAGVSAKEYWAYVENILANPVEIWSGVFSDQLDPMGRTIVALVVFNGGELSEAELRTACRRMPGAAAPTSSATEWALAFERSYKMAVGAVINREISDATRSPVTTLFNPSVGDFVLRKYSEDPNAIFEIISALRSESALMQFGAICKSGIIKNEHYVLILRRLTETFWLRPIPAINFAIQLAARIIADRVLRAKFHDPLLSLADEFLTWAEECTLCEELVEVVKWLVEAKALNCDDPRLLQLSLNVIRETSDDRTLIPLSAVIAFLPENDAKTAEKKLRRVVVENWQDQLDDFIRENNVAEDYLDVDNDVEDAREDVENFIRGSLKDYAFPFSDAEVTAILEKCDIDNLIYVNQELHDRDSYDRDFEGEMSSKATEAELIDDLFDRSGSH